MNFCEYKDIFGEVGKGLHKYRIFGFAAVDIIATIVVAIIINWLIPKFNFLLLLIILFLLGIIVHKLFCVPTALNNMIFGK